MNVRIGARRINISAGPSKMKTMHEDHDIRGTCIQEKARDRFSNTLALNKLRIEVATTNNMLPRRNGPNGIQVVPKTGQNRLIRDPPATFLIARQVHVNEAHDLARQPPNENMILCMHN
jgi:hypothetical protein